MGRLGREVVMKLALLFPGQGSQFSGMGRKLAEQEPAAREVFQEAGEALGFDLANLCFHGKEEDLALTENTQPAVLTHSIAALKSLQARGLPAPAAAAGHSLGEYSAHVCAGTLSFADAVRTVRARGRFMQEAVPVGEGSMAAVIGLEPEQVEDLCRRAAEGEVLSPANLNSPGQIVIAGHRGAVRRAVDSAGAAGARKAILLPVSAPFHCSLMRPAAASLLPVLRSVDFGRCRLPVYTNVDARPVRTAEEARDALYRQVCRPVRWIETIRNMVAAGVDVFLEVGPGKVLTGLVRRIDRKVKVKAVQDPDGMEKALSILTVAGG